MNKTPFLPTILFILLFGHSILTAQTDTTLTAQADTTAASEANLLKDNVLFEIDELIVNDTQTKVGHDFFDMFYQLWESADRLDNYKITISEHPLPQLGTRITIEINDLVVYQQMVQPRYEALEASVNQAVEISIQYLTNYEEIQRSLQDEDLSGSGIY